MIKKKILLVIPYNRGTIGLCSLNLYKSLLKSATTEVRCAMIHKFENGSSGNVSLGTFLLLLKAIGQIDALDELMPDLPPSAYLVKEEKKVQRIMEIERYIKYYNEQRIKEKLGWMSPVEYRLTHLAA